MASFSVKYEVESARNHQPCLNTVSLHQVIPRLKPGGRKKLRDGLEAQDTILLFRHDDSFTEKRQPFGFNFEHTILFIPAGNGPAG
jgi:hypothetical protein